MFRLEPSYVVPTLYHTPVEIVLVAVTSEYAVVLFRNLNFFIPETFGIYKKNRKGENTSELDIFKNKPFGPSTLWKTIEKLGFENFINSHPYIKRNYEMNRVLILEEHIPSKLEERIIEIYNIPTQEYSLKNIEEFFKKYQLFKLMPEINILLKGYKQKELLTADDFGWVF